MVPDPGVGLASVDSLVLAAVRFATNAVTGVSLDQSVVLAVTNLIQTWVAVVLLRRWCGELWGCGGTRALDSPRTTIRYVAALAGGMVAGVAVGAVGTFIVQNELTATRYVLWFDRNFCGAVAVTTLGLLVGQRLASKNRRPLIPGGRAEWVEIAAATALTVVTYTLAFALDSVPMAFPLLVATVWVGVRFATLLSVLHSFAVGTAAIVLTLSGHRTVRAAGERGGRDPARAVLPGHAPDLRPAPGHRPRRAGAARRRIWRRPARRRSTRPGCSTPSSTRWPRASRSSTTAARS